MKNRKLILILSLVLALTMSLGGTLAYLTDTDADVNTMVLGNVQIVQNEQQWNDDKSELEEFEQNKPLLPYVGTLGWENKEDQNGAYRRFTMNNVVDKYVTVTNKGNTNAYVRTIIAVEMGGYEDISEYYYKTVGISYNAANGSEFKFDGTWEWDEKYVAVIDNVNYMIMTATHKNPVAAKTTTIPSLLQVYVNKDCDNEELVKLDGNKNGKLDIIVLSQAVQADGFGDAKTALEAGFPYEEKDENGNVIKTKEQTIAEWLGDVLTAEPEEIQPDANNVYEISTADQLFGFAKMVNEGKNSFAGKTVKLTADINLANQKWEPIGQTRATQFQGTFDGNDYTIYNLFVDSSEQTGEHYSSGLFGWLEGKSNISNVNINGAKIVGHHNTGVIAGYAYANITNCTVTGAEVINTHDNDDACGDKAGVIAGYAGDGHFTNNHAENCTVTAGRDAGQLFGCIIASQEKNFVNNTAENVVVKAAGDCTGANIKNEIIGRK